MKWFKLAFICSVLLLIINTYNIFVDRNDSSIKPRIGTAIMCERDNGCVER